MQRAAHFAGLALGVERLGIGNGGRIDLDNGVERRTCVIDRGNAIQIGLGQRARRERAGRPSGRVPRVALSSTTSTVETGGACGIGRLFARAASKDGDEQNCGNAIHLDWLVSEFSGFDAEAQRRRGIVTTSAECVSGL